MLVIMLQLTHESQKTLWMLNLLQTIEVYESRYKHQAKLFTEKLFVSSLNSIV